MQFRIVADKTCLLDSVSFREKLDRPTALQYAAMDLQVRLHVLSVLAVCHCYYVSLSLQSGSRRSRKSDPVSFLPTLPAVSENPLDIGSFVCR